MPDYQFTRFPIPGKEVDFEAIQNEITALQEMASELQQQLATLTARTINGYDLSEDRTLFVQDIPSKNLLPNTATSQTINGVTFTVNSNGSITVNGTATADTNLFFANDLTIGAGTYIITGCPQGGSIDTFHLNCQVDNRWVDGRDDGNGKQFTASVGVTRAAVTIKAGVVASNLIFYPMIRLASIEDDTYVPYAKTNVELTDDSIVYSGTITASQGTLSGESSIRRIGKIVYLRLTLTGLPTNLPDSVVSAILPEGFRPYNYIRGAGMYGTTAYSQTTACYFMIDPSGNVYINKPSGGTVVNITVTYFTA